MKISPKSTISKLPALVLAASIFCSFFLCAGDLYAAKLSSHESLPVNCCGASPCHPQQTPGSISSNDHYLFDFIQTEVITPKNSSETRPSKKSFFLPASIKILLQNPACFYHRYQRLRFADNSSPLYLFLKNLRI
jgi:hypothetical protein